MKIAENDPSVPCQEKYPKPRKHFTFETWKLDEYNSFAIDLTIIPKTDLMLTVKLWSRLFRWEYLMF